MLLKLAWRNLWRNKKRSIITISSITIAVFLAVFMRSMQLGAYQNMIKNVVGSYVGYVQIHAIGYWDEQTLDNALTVTPDLLNTVESENGVENVLERIESFALGSANDETKGVMIQGIDIEKEQQMVDWNKRLVKGQLFSKNDRDIILAKGVAKFFKVNVGDTIIFIGQGYHGMSAAGKFKICGIVDMKSPKINNMSVFISKLFNI
jgi:ABC-type lipoprotein release transport system permease subunit